VSIPPVPFVEGVATRTATPPVDPASHDVGACRRRTNDRTTSEERAMPQYLMSVWHDDEYVVDFTTEEMQRIGPQVGAFNAELEQAGAMVFAAGLKPASSATVLRPSGSGVSMTDGPYAETKEQMGGFWVIEATDLDVALDWARRASDACEQPVELRPMQDEG
jgi:hypothetical protein